MRQRLTIYEKFWKYVDKNGPIPQHLPNLGQCWIWTSCKDKDGYGWIGLTKKSSGFYNKRAHRISALIHGISDILTENQLILHKCDNPGCVNPEHLFIGTTEDNVKDRVSKNRTAIQSGSSHGYAKLVESQVLEIRAKYATGNYTQDKLATEYKVVRPMISLIVNRKNWTHI